MSDHTDETRPRAPLTVHTDLTLTVDGTELPVTSTGERLFVEFPSLPSAVRTLRRSPQGERHRLHDLLTTTDLTVEVRVRGRTVAVSGAGARPGILSRELGVDPVELRIGGVFGAVGRELSAAVERVRGVGRRLRGR
ncbi:hypothetical protein [Halogeometricum limi]|uniref:Peptide ABC transporter ATP-binding protein n=1 Tax=Halogeometricum limi TaxID=555875 RepID=A0A1I6IA15_9EURY|nr:hypothetical protein [Halogeometricum limi]SFR63597.1 hypothetical protein SAMN04488124_2926 [Halogeometricum limi]